MQFTQRPIELFAAKKDIRYYLNGVYFDAKAKVLVATNGHALARVKVECDKDDKTSGIIPLEAIKRIRELTKAKVKDADIVRLTPKAGGTEYQGIITLKDGSTFVLIDGSFPDFTRVIPKAADRPLKIGVNAEYLEQARKFLAFTGFQQGGIMIHATKLKDGVATDTSLVAGAHDSYPDENDPIVVVMPMRLK